MCVFVREEVANRDLFRQRKRAKLLAFLQAAAAENTNIMRDVYRRKIPTPLAHSYNQSVPLSCCDKSTTALTGSQTPAQRMDGLQEESLNKTSMSRLTRSTLIPV